MFASPHEIDGPLALTDCNKLQSLAKVEKNLELENFADAKMSGTACGRSYINITKSRRIQ